MRLEFRRFRFVAVFRGVFFFVFRIRLLGVYSFSGIYIEVICLFGFRV